MGRSLQDTPSTMEPNLKLTQLVSKCNSEVWTYGQWKSMVLPQTHQCKDHTHDDELPLALDAYSDTCGVWTNLSEHFPSISDPMQAFSIICQPQITIINSHNHSPHVCKPPAKLRDKFRPFPTLLSLKFWLSSYSDILPVSLQLSGQLLAWLCSLQSHDHLPSIAFVSQWTSEPF